MTLRIRRITLSDLLLATLLLLPGAFALAQEQGMPFNEGAFSESHLDSLRSSKAYLYGTEPLTEAMQTSWFLEFLQSLGPAIRWTVYIILILLVIGVVYLVVRRLIVAPSRSIPDTSVAVGAQEEEALSAEALGTRWEAAVQAGDYRLAVRYLFLRNLRLMDREGWVRWEPGKTNLEYAAELHRPDTRETFRSMAWQFEYVWYGNMNLSADAYQHLEAPFLQFQQLMKNRG